MRPAQKQVKKGVRHLNSNPLSRNHHDQGLNGNAKQRQNIPEFSHLTTSGNGISEVPVTAELLHAPVAQEGDTFFVQTNRRASFCGNEAERSTSGKWFPQVPTEKVALTLEEAKTVLGECSRMGDMLQGIFEDFLCASPADAGNKEADELSMDGEAGSHERSTAGTGTISITMSGKWGKVDSSANGVHSPVGPARDEASASIASPLVVSSPLKSDAKKRERELIGETSMTCQAGEESSSGEVLPKEELSCNTYHGGADSPLVTGQTDEEDQGRQRLPKVDSTGGAKNSALKNELLKCQATCEEVAMKMLNQYIQAEKDDVQEQKALAALHLRAGQDLCVSGSNLQLDSDLLTAACGDLLDSRQIIKSTFQQISDESNEPTADTTNARRSYLAPTKSVQNRLRCTRTLGGLKPKTLKTNSRIPLLSVRREMGKPSTNATADRAAVAKNENKEQLAKLQRRQSFLRNSRQDPNTALKGQCPFDIEPDAAIFHGFRIGLSYKQTIIFRNSSHLGRRLRVELAAPNKDLRVSPVVYKSLASSYGQPGVSAEHESTLSMKGKASSTFTSAHPTGTIAPGLSAQVEVRFQPTSFDDITTHLLLHTDVGSFSIAVLCRRELAHLPALPPLVDFGTCMVGEVPEVRIPVRNEGGEAVFTVAHFPCGDKDQELLENSKYELHLPLAIHKPTATANVQHAGNEYQKGHSPDLAISARFKHRFFTLDPASFALKKGEEQEVCVRFASQKAGVFENDYVIRSDSGQTWPLRFKACATSTQIELVQFDGKPWTMQRLFDAEDWYEGERRRDVGNDSFEKVTSNWKGEPGGERGQKEAQNGIALRALPNKICFGEVQVDGGVTERRMSLRNRSQLPVKLRWRLLPGHPYAIDIHADGENRHCQFSLNPTSIDLEPGATQEFIFSFKPYKQGIKIRKVAEATAELEVADVTRASLKTLPELLQQRGASDNKDFPLTLWSSNIQSHDLGVVSNGCSSDFVTAKLLSISLHGVPIASEVTLLPPSLELQLLPSLVHFERLLVVNNASCPAPFQLAPINRFVEVYPDKKEKRAGVGNSDMRIAAQSKGFSGFSTHDNDNEGPHSPSSCLSHGFASHKRVREGLLLVDMDEIENITRLGWETETSTSLRLPDDEGGSTPDKVKVVGYFALSACNGLASAKSSAELSLALSVLDCSSLSFVLPLRVTAASTASSEKTASAEDLDPHIGDPQHSLRHREDVFSPFVSVNVHVVVSPPQLQLMYEPTLDFGVVRAHSQARQWCRIKNPSDVPTVAWFRSLPWASVSADSLHKDDLCATRESLSASVSGPPFSRYYDLIQSLGKAAEIAFTPKGCFSPAASVGHPAPVSAKPAFHQLTSSPAGNMIHSTGRNHYVNGARCSESGEKKYERKRHSAETRACAKCSCIIDYCIEDSDRRRTFEKAPEDIPRDSDGSLVAARMSVHPHPQQGCPQCYSGRHSAVHALLTFFPCWVVVPAHGTADIAVILNTSHPERLSRDVAVDWLGVDGGLVVNIQATVQLPVVRLSRPAMQLDFCYIHIPRQIQQDDEDALVFLHNDSDLPATYSWQAVSLAAAEGNTSASCPAAAPSYMSVSYSQGSVGELKPLAIRFRPESGTLAPRSHQAIRLDVVAHKVAPQLQAAAACFISGLLNPLYFKVETPCRGLQMKLAVLDETRWKRGLLLEPQQKTNHGYSTAPATSIRASNDTALVAEPMSVDEGISRFRNPAVCLPELLPDCDQLHAAGLALPRQIEMKDSWEGCNGRPIIMDPIRIDDLTPEEPKLFYLVLSNACYIPATFCISAARFAAVPVDCGTPEHAVRQGEDTKRTATLQVKETQLPGDGLSFREIPAAVRSIQSRTQRSMQERRNTIAALPPTQEGAVYWCHEAGDVRGLPLEVERVSSRQNKAAIDANYNLRQVLHRYVSHSITSTREPPSSKVTPLLNCDAFFGAPGYLSAAGQEHCAAATEEKRRALLLRGGNGFTVMTSPAAGRLPAHSTRCICIEFLTDMPGTFEDTLILELQAHPFRSSFFAESDVAAHSSFRQTLKLQVHFPLHVSSVGNSLLFAPCQPALDVTAEPCPLLSVSSCIVSSRLMARVSAKVSNASRLSVRKSAIQTAIPLNSVAAAAAGAAGAAAWRSDQQVLYNADRQAQRAVVLSGNCGGFSPKTTRVDSGSILSSPILPPVGIFKVFNRGSRDMSMNWQVFDLDAWDKQSREHARAPPEATEPGVATRAAEQTAAAEAAAGMELCPELQTQRGTEPATGVAAPTAESCRIPRGGPAQQKSNSEAVSFDIATAAYPGATLGGADGGRANSPPSGDQAGWQFSASVEGDHARQGKEAIGQQGGDAAADTGEQQGPLVESHGRENERDTPVEEAERDTVDVAKDRGCDTRLNRSVTTLVPPNDCAIENVLQNVRASMQASIWVDGIQHNGTELGKAPRVVVSPEQCVVKAKSTRTFRITFDGVQGTADKRRFRLVGTGSHVDRTGSHASVSDPAGLLGPPAGSCGRKSGSSASSCSDRATWGSVERVPNACSIAASQATRQRRSAHDNQPANEVANLPAGLPEESDDEEEDAWCGDSAHPVSALGGEQVSATSAVISTLARDAPQVNCGKRSGRSIDEPNDGEGTVGGTLSARAPVEPAQACNGEAQRVRDRQFPRNGDRTAGILLPNESILVLDVNASFHEPRVVVEQSQEDVHPDSDGKKSFDMHIETGSSPNSHCRETDPLCTFTATPSSVVGASPSSTNGETDLKCYHPINHSRRQDTLRHTVYLQNPLPCDVHVKFHTEGNYFSITEIKVDRNSAVGEPYNPRAGEAMTLRPGQSGKLHLRFEPPPLSFWSTPPLTVFRAFLVASFPSAPSNTRAQRWPLAAFCRQPAVRLQESTGDVHSRSIPVSGYDYPMDVVTPLAYKPSLFRVSFGRVHLAARKAVKRTVVLSNSSLVLAKWSISHLPRDTTCAMGATRPPFPSTSGHRKTRTGNSSQLTLCNNTEMPADDASAFRFDIRDGVLEPCNNGSVGSFPKEVSSGKGESHSIAIFFKPRKAAFHRSRFQICVEYGQSVEFELEGVGSIDEEDDAS